MKVSFKPFFGIRPRIERHLLAATDAVAAKNVRMETGALVPLRAPQLVTTLAKAGQKKTIYRFGKQFDTDLQWWFHWSGDVDLCLGPVVDDTVEQTYYTGDGPPKYTNSVIATNGGQMPTGFYLLGVPTPTKPNATSSGAPTESDSDQITVIAAYSYVTADGEPGPPSPVSEQLLFQIGQTLTVSGMDGPPSGQYNITTKRIWVSLTDSTGSTALRYWADVPVGTASFSALVNFDTLGESVDDPSLIPPPATMFGIGAHPNGFLFGFDKRTVLRSEVFKPYGWPDAYKDPVAFDIVGGKVLGQSIVVCTKGLTYLVSGQDPLNMSVVDLAGNYPCSSKRSIVKMTFGVVYAAAEGLVLVTGNGPLVLATEGFFTREQWQAMVPTSMHGIAAGRFLYLWYSVTYTDSTTKKAALIFEFDGSGSISKISETDQYATAAFFDERRAEVFIAKEDGSLYKWDVGAPLTQYWESREVRFDRPQNVGAARVRAKKYPVTLKTYHTNTYEANGAQQDVDYIMDEITVPDARPFRLSSRYRFVRWRFSVSSTTKITEVEFGSTIADLRSEDG